MMQLNFNFVLVAGCRHCFKLKVEIQTSKDREYNTPDRCSQTRRMTDDG